MKLKAKAKHHKFQKAKEVRQEREVRLSARRFVISTRRYFSAVFVAVFFTCVGMVASR